MKGSVSKVGSIEAGSVSFGRLNLFNAELSLKRYCRRWGKRETMPYTYLHCHHQNDFCMKMGSRVSQFNVSLIIVKDRVIRRRPQTTTFEERREPERNRTEVIQRKA